MRPGLGFTELQANTKEVSKAAEFQDCVERSWQEPRERLCSPVDGERGCRIRQSACNWSSAKHRACSQTAVGEEGQRRRPIWNTLLTGSLLKEV